MRHAIHSVVSCIWKKLHVSALSTVCPKIGVNKIYNSMLPKKVQHLNESQFHTPTLQAQLNTKLFTSQNRSLVYASAYINNK